MKKGQLFVFGLCAVLGFLSACGPQSKKSEKIEYTQPTDRSTSRYLNADQKQQYAGVLIGVFRSWDAINAAYGTVEGAQAKFLQQYTFRQEIRSSFLEAIHSFVGSLESKDENLEKMIAMIKENCTPVVKEQQDGNHLKVIQNLNSLEDKKCPLHDVRTMEGDGSSTEDLLSFKGTLSATHEVVREDYRELNDLLRTDDQGSIFLDIKKQKEGEEVKVKELTFGGNATGRVVSVKEGELPTGLSGNFNFKVLAEDKITMNAEIIHTTTFPSFAAELKMLLRTEGSRLVLELYLNGEKISENATVQMSLVPGSFQEILQEATFLQ